MWQKRSNYKIAFFLVFSLLGSNIYVNASELDNVQTHILDNKKKLSEQLSYSNAVYIIRDNFDLRETVIDLNLKKSFKFKNKNYYRNQTIISLQAGQGIWVPKDILIMNKSLDTVLSKDGIYIPKKPVTLYLCSSKLCTIDYQISAIVTMPEDCVLKFEGGLLSNGIIRSVRTQIQAPPVHIFGENMYFGWYWDIVEAYPEWFGAKGGDDSDDGYAIQKCLDSFRNTRLTNHNYYTSETIYIPSHGSLIGAGKYQTSIFYTKSVDNMICTDTKNTTTEIVISNISFNKSKKDLSIKNGVKIHSATGSRIESVSVSGADIGFALNSYFGSQIKSCIAYDCNIGFYLGVNEGSSTSVDYDNCYANKCAIGHLFRKCSYITTKNTSTDYCETAYDFVESVVTLVSPGAECCKYFIRIIPHPELSSINNYAHNNIYVINGQSIANEPNSDGVIYFATETRGYEDRNRLVIDGLSIAFKKDTSKNKLLHKVGDGVLHINNLTSYLQPDIEAINYYRDGVGVLNSTSLLKYWSDKKIGTSVFVTSLHKPLFWDGKQWVDSMGSPFN